VRELQTATPQPHHVNTKHPWPPHLCVLSTTTLVSCLSRPTGSPSSPASLALKGRGGGRTVWRPNGMRREVPGEQYTDSRKGVLGKLRSVLAAWGWWDCNVSHASSFTAVRWPTVQTPQARNTSPCLHWARNLPNITLITT
jgi:hypothetical protein